mmetsp:Transcript_28479/g.37243  ORF Transcript_28479/g.37243 Transcript_28479/m.37243 type:complete len:105 (+) Transcript_28479:1342-1656(+)
MTFLELKKPKKQHHRTTSRTSGFVFKSKKKLMEWNFTLSNFIYSHYGWFWNPRGFVVHFCFFLMLHSDDTCMMIPALTKRNRNSPWEHPFNVYRLLFSCTNVLI